MTEEQAKALYNSGFWKTMSYFDRAWFQLHEERLCMPFDVFHEAVEKALNRAVFTHEFGLNWDGLVLEIEGKGPAPSLEEIIRLIPAEKRVVLDMSTGEMRSGLDDMSRDN